jgi:lipopolysaccharide/colanic/teichoic acid biosynthesis glycosyltransferase
MLERERARADRSGLGFCLVVFGPVSDSDGAAPSHPLARLARTVLRRARVTDEVGWFADESVAEAGASRAGRKLTASRVCALLPDTAAAGARRFAADVLDNLRSAAAAADGLPEIRIYGYGLAPAESDAVVTGHGRGRDKDKDDRNCGGNARNGGSSAATSHRRHGETTIPDHAATRLHDVEGLLIKHLPAWKRAIDVVAASLALVVLSPVMLIAALAVRLSSRGPVLFRQERAGLGGRPFTMYKFRSMVAGAEARRDELLGLNEQDGPAFKIRHDPRVTRVGKFLRKTSLDELPQLVNVLTGDMTLVGPRPLPLAESDGCDRWHRRRLDVTPGLTCVWQVEGRNEVLFDDWMRMDLKYIRSRGVWTDLWLILRTIPAVLLRKGAR